MYPRAVQFKNIKPDKRFCSKCGCEIRGRGHFYYIAIAKGKYLCNRCNNERNGKGERNE